MTGTGAQRFRIVAERSNLLESEHVIDISVVRDGAEIQRLGNSSRKTFLRSAAKPIYAAELASQMTDLSPKELAVACSSHDGGASAVSAVRALLSRADAGAEDLRCTRSVDARETHPCSGSHAAMICLASRMGVSRRGYTESDHPVQVRLVETVAEAVGRKRSELALVGDGCCTPTAQVSVFEAARAYSALACRRLSGSEAVLAAMRAWPTLIGAADSPDVAVMQSIPGAMAKVANGGLLCIALPNGCGVALKCADGSQRALGLAAMAVLGISNQTSAPTFDDGGTQVGSLRADFTAPAIPG